MRSLLTGLVLCLTLASCDQLTGASTGANDSLGPGRTSGDLLQTDGSLQGHGEIIFSEPLGPIKGAKNFELIFELEVDGSLEVQTYTRDDLSGGVGLVVKRLNDQLEVRIKGDGYQKTFYTPFEDIDPSKKIHWVIDSHNDHDDANHLLIWEYRSSGNYTASNALLNSDFFKLPLDLDGLEFFEWHDNGVKGKGAFWGLKLQDARVIKYKTSAPLNEG